MCKLLCLCGKAFFFAKIFSNIAWEMRIFITCNQLIFTEVILSTTNE